jgi:uncharacterized membrane protein YhaH (DUF805 family)
MGFGEAIKTCFSKYATFSGRARRSEFWWFYLFIAIISGIPSAYIYFQTYANADAESASIGILGILVGLLNLALVLPFIAVSVRRLHDRDSSGWWWWLSVLCGLGALILILAFYIQPTKPGPNKYGPDPTGAVA